MSGEKKFDIYPARGSFIPGMKPEFIIENQGGADRVEMRVYRGAELLGCVSERLVENSIEGKEPERNSIEGKVQERSSIEENEAERNGIKEMETEQNDKGNVHLRIRFPEEIFLSEKSTGEVQDLTGGYGVEAHFYRDDVLQGTSRTAFDILPEGQQIRYGFLSDFATEDRGEEDILSMLKLHINAVQFYDWSYRHDELVAPVEQFTDMMGKKNDLSVIRQKVDSCHAYGMKALGYGAVYAASKDYQEQHPEQSLYDTEGEPLRFIDVFYIMNVDRKNGWHNRIIQQYRRAVAEVDFDGIHMDTYGDPKRALDENGNVVYLEDHFPVLIDDTRKALEEEKEDITLIFNNVGGWPVERTMYANQSAVYIEVWPPNVSYHHLGTLINNAKLSGKQVILAAYPAAFRLDTPERALESQLFLSFVIAMHGATQLFFGEKNAVITQGYYADYTVLTDAQMSSIRAQQDFFVQYRDYFYDPALEDVSMTHQGWDNKEYAFSPEGSADGESGKVWYHIRQSRNKKVIYFVNLLENNDLWNEGKNSPTQSQKIMAEIQMLKDPKTVWFAEPGQNGNKAREVDYHWKQENQSKVLCAEVAVFRCGMLVVEE